MSRWPTTRTDRRFVRGSSVDRDYAAHPCAATANLGLLLAQDATAAILFRFLTGACLAFVYPSSLKAMSTWFRYRRGTAPGVMVGALTVGSALPHLINGVGGSSGRIAVGATFIATVSGGLLAGFVFHDGPFPFPKAPFDPRQIGQLVADRAVRLATLGYFGHM